MIDMLVGAVEALDDRRSARLRHRHRPRHRRGRQGEARGAQAAHAQAGDASSSICPLPEACEAGTYVGPAVYEIAARGRAEGGGVRARSCTWCASRAATSTGSIDAINATGYGLTLGLHSRIAAVADCVAERARVGNLYVNRNQIGAVVGVQPFGGEGLSGTGPKAGGPNYLARFATERVRTTDITATGRQRGAAGVGIVVVGRVSAARRFTQHTDAQSRVTRRRPNVGHVGLRASR